MPWRWPRTPAPPQDTRRSEFITPVLALAAILVLLGALAGVFAAVIVLIASIVVGLIVAPWTVGVCPDVGSVPLLLLSSYLLSIAECAASAGYWQAIRIRCDHLGAPDKLT